MSKCLKREKNKFYNSNLGQCLVQGARTTTNLQFSAWKVVEFPYFRSFPSQFVGRIGFLWCPPRPYPHIRVSWPGSWSRTGRRTGWRRVNQEGGVRGPTPLQISLASLLRDFGYDTLWSVMALKSSSSSSPSNGGWPTSISYNKTPNAHQSTDLL